jgi:hypothetical protein
LGAMQAAVATNTYSSINCTKIARLYGAIRATTVSTCS